MAKEKENLEKEDVRKIILDLAEEGKTSEKIGIILKEKYGVYAKNFGLKIGRVLREEDKWVDPDIKNVKKKLERLEENLRESKHDYPAKQAMFQKGAKLRSLKKYRK